MAPSQLADLSITEAASGLRRKEFSPSELTRACLERIESIDHKLHSFITVTADLALEQLERLNRTYALVQLKVRFMVFPSLSKIFMRPKESARPAIRLSCRIGCRITTRRL